MTKFVVIASLLFPALSLADDDRAWTTFDTVSQVAVTAAFAADWNQTIRIGAAGVEASPYLGTHPNRKNIAIWFSSWMVGHILTAIALPKPYRTIWQGLFLGVEGATVRHNMRYGWQVKF